VKRETGSRIRPATPADLPALLALERGAPTAAHWSEADYQQLFAAGRVTIVIAEDHVQGFIVARDLGPEWEIENIVIASAVQRRGLGTRLVQELLELAQTQGAQAVFLEVRESNRAARTLYSKMGFVESRRRKAYYRNPDEDAIVYKKFLPQARGKSC
jgi:[ribosomal protein S18]-alanine N-acetyltransferase